MSTPATHTWQPTTARIVVVEGFGPYPPGALQTQPPALIWPIKDPGDTLDYVFDVSAGGLTISPAGSLRLSTSGGIFMSGLPTTRPIAGSGQVWNNNGVLSIA